MYAFNYYVIKHFGSERPHMRILKHVVGNGFLYALQNSCVGKRLYKQQYNYIFTIFFVK